MPEPETSTQIIIIIMYMYNEAFGAYLNKGIQSHQFSFGSELSSSFLPFQLVYLSSSSK